MIDKKDSSSQVKLTFEQSDNSDKKRMPSFTFKVKDQETATKFLNYLKSLDFNALKCESNKITIDKSHAIDSIGYYVLLQKKQTGVAFPSKEIAVNFLNL